jgi:hypothetical protein
MLAKQSLGYGIGIESFVKLLRQIYNLSDCPLVDNNHPPLSAMKGVFLYVKHKLGMEVLLSERDNNHRRAIHLSIKAL